MSLRSARYLRRAPQTPTPAGLSPCFPPLSASSRGAGRPGPGARPARRLLSRKGRSERRPRRAAGKHRGSGALKLTVSRRLAKQTDPCGVDLPGAPQCNSVYLLFGNVYNDKAAPVRCGTQRGRRPQQVEVVAELQLQAARMAASCVCSCRFIHVVTKHEAGNRSGRTGVVMQ